MATKTIKQITRTLTTVNDIDLVNGYIEGQDSATATGSYQVSLSLLQNKFLMTGTTYLSTLGSLTSPTTVGGIPAGTAASSLTGKTFTQLFDELLYPTINPVLVGPSNTFVTDASSLKEIGWNGSILFTNTFNKGSITLNSIFQNYRSGNAGTYNWYGSGFTGSPFISANFQETRSITIVQGYQSWTGSTNYLIGPQPFDNKGVDYGTPLAAGTSTQVTTTIEGIYPLFGTTVLPITVFTQQSDVSMITGNYIVFTMVTESGGNKQAFDIPDTWLASRPLVNVETYNTVSSTWTSTGLGQWTTSSITRTIQSIPGIPYTRYTFNGSERGNTDIRLVF